MDRTYHVTRQHYWYANAERFDTDEPVLYAVEIAKGHDSIGPDALVATYGYLGEFEEFSDPRDAVKAALRVRNAWRDAYTGEPAEFTLSRFDGDFYTDEEIIAWGEQEYKNLPKCDACGDILGDETYRWEDETYCSEHCLERAAAPSWEDWD